MRKAIQTTLRATLPAAALLLAVAQPAAAQTPVYNWSGFYVGVHAGYGWGTTDIDTATTYVDSHGALAGGQIGFNQQIGNLVIGIETELSWAGISGERSYVSGGPLIGSLTSQSASADIDWLAATSLRLGLAAERLLVYGKFGVAWAHAEYGLGESTTLIPGPTFTESYTADHNRFGLLFGFGTEYAFTDRWSGRIEYNYIAFAPRSVTFATTGGVPFTAEVAQHFHLAKLGLNYRFGTAAPLPQVMPARAAGYDWSGFYIGAQAGYGFGRTDWLALGPPDGNYTTDGWLGGGQIGANIQAGVFVAGLEADWAWTGIGRSQTITAPGVTTTLSTDVNWLATVTGRVGVTPWSGALLYGKAGAALADIHQERRVNTAGFSVDAAGAQLYAGYVFGAGLEHMLFGNWSAKLEYNHVAFFDRGHVLEGQAVFPAGTIANAENHEFKQSLQVVKLGINYRFAPPPPP
jgi:outer membrane immunogenic protein